MSQLVFKLIRTHARRQTKKGNTVWSCNSITKEYVTLSCETHFTTDLRANTQAREREQGV